MVGLSSRKGGGGGATINNQDKVVDITENGTTEVVADGGFTGLGKVTINTEVSGGGESGGDEWQYYDVRNNTMPDGQWMLMMTMIPTIVALRTDDGDWAYIGSASIFALLGVEDSKARLKAIGINMDIKQYSSVTGNQLMSFKEMELAQGQSVAALLASFGCPPITEAEFYDLNA